MKRIVILANGPGELWCWVRPVIRALAEAGVNVSLRLLPCQYAAGNEAEIAGRLGVADISPPMSIFSHLARGEKHPPDAVLQMGGDLLFGLALSRRNGVPFFCYTYGVKPLLGRCDAIFTPFEETSRSFKSVCERTFVSGDLVADSMDMDEDAFSWPGGGGRKIVFFPGSRRAIRSAALPFIKRIWGSLQERVNDVEHVCALSSFATGEEEAAWKDEGLNPSRASARAILCEADLALTQPGTNTLEIAYAGVPGIVAVPFQFLRQVPLPGLAGLISSLPLAGPWIKESLLRRAGRRRGFLAWPNRLLGQEVMPEVVGDFSAEDIASVAAELLCDPSRLSLVRSDLGKIPCGKGSAGRMVDKIKGILG